jgi:hypothetical protein
MPIEPQVSEMLELWDTQEHCAAAVPATKKKTIDTTRVVRMDFKKPSFVN